MIGTMLQYAYYHPSIDDRLGKVPGHWRSTSLGAIATRKSARNRPDMPLLSVLREKGVVLRSSLSKEENHNFIPDDLSNYLVANEGDLVVNKMKAWQGSLGIAPQDGIVSPAYYVFELADIKKKYAHRLLRSRLYADFFGRASDGVRIGQWDLRIPAMKRIPVLIPPPDEQDSIARYLDEMDRHIARFIRNRRWLIEVLNEQKQAIINRAVTRGLDSKASLVESGIAWAPEIPAHWQIIPNRGLFTFKKDVVGARWSQFDLLSLTKRGVILRDMENPEGKFPASFESYQVINPGDFVFCLFDVDETPRAVGVSSMHGMITGAYTRFECCRPEYSGFLYNYYLAMDFDKRLKPLYRGLRKVIPKGTFLTTKTPVPPVEEARQIVLHIEEQTRAADIAIEKAQREISLIIEYRTRLISDVVTGKIDVRHLVPKPGSEDLEETFEALEPLEDVIADVEIDDEEAVNESD